jgi:hypothetical protein
MNRQQLQSRLSTVTSELLHEKGYISFVDVFMKLGYLDAKDYESWRRKRVSCLERVIIMRTVRQNSLKGKLIPSRTAYKSWGKGTKILLRFSKSREEPIEQTYAIHFVKPKKRKA